MSGRFEGKSVFITGAARGQGRSHALAFAREGADVAVSDICADISSVPYGLSREDDLSETVRLCEPRAWLEPEDVSGLVRFLASDDAAYITGAEMKIDKGMTAI